MPLDPLILLFPVGVTENPGVEESGYLGPFSAWPFVNEVACRGAKFISL